MANGDTSSGGGSLWEKIKPLIPYVASGAIGGMLGGPAGAAAGLGGAGESQVEQERLRSEKMEKALGLASLMQERQAQQQYHQEELQSRKDIAQEQIQSRKDIAEQNNQFRNMWKLSEEANQHNNLEERVRHDQEMEADRELAHSMQGGKFVSEAGFKKWLALQVPEIQQQGNAVMGDPAMRTTLYNNTISGRIQNMQYVRDQNIARLEKAFGRSLTPEEVAMAATMAGPRLGSLAAEAEAGRLRTLDPKAAARDAAKDAAAISAMAKDITSGMKAHAAKLAKQGWGALNPFATKIPSLGNDIKLTDAALAGFSDAQRATAEREARLYLNSHDKDPENVDPLKFASLIYRKYHPGMFPSEGTETKSAGTGKTETSGAAAEFAKRHGL